MSYEFHILVSNACVAGLIVIAVITVIMIVQSYFEGDLS